MNTFKSLPSKIKTFIICMLIISAGLIISNIVFIKQIHELKNPGEASVNEIKKIVSDIGSFIVLPADETPTLATVSDPDKLKDQKFFANAETGDKVLLYQTSQKAILWRPSTKKIIEISSLNSTAPVK
jgi:hypothetical protein